MVEDTAEGKIKAFDAGSDKKMKQASHKPMPTREESHDTTREECPGLPLCVINENRDV